MTLEPNWENIVRIMILWGDGEERRRRYTRSIVDNESNSINFRLS